MPHDVLDRLYQVIQDRRKASPDTSYIAKRLKQGTPKIAQKFGEEAVETVIAAMRSDKQEVISESTDFLFHWLLLLADQQIRPQEVMDELHARMEIAGLDEKARLAMKEKE